MFWVKCVNICIFCLLIDYYENSGSVEPFFKGMSSRGPPPLKRGPPVRNGGPPPKRSAPSGPMSRGKCERILLVFISSSEKRRAGSVDFSRFIDFHLWSSSPASTQMGCVYFRVIWWLMSQFVITFFQPPCQGIGIPMVHPLLAETPWCPGGTIIHHREMTITTQKIGRKFSYIIQCCETTWRKWETQVFVDFVEQKQKYFECLFLTSKQCSFIHKLCIKRYFNSD